MDNPGVDWSKWHVAYADERNVSHSSDDSNHKGAKEAFLEKVSQSLMKAMPPVQELAIVDGVNCFNLILAPTFLHF